MEDKVYDAMYLTVDGFMDALLDVDKLTISIGGMTN